MNKSLKNLITSKNCEVIDEGKEYILVKSNDTGLFYFVNNKGISSDGFYYAENFKNGFATIQKCENSKLQHLNKFWQLSKPFLKSYGFNYGCAIIKDENNAYRILNQDFRLSQRFTFADNYYDGLARVQSSWDGRYRYIDDEGLLSDSYYFAGNYKKGFASVLTRKNAPRCLRDLLGNLSKNKTRIGTMTYNYFKNKISAVDILKEFPNDPLLKVFVERNEMKKILNEIRDKYENLSDITSEIRKSYIERANAIKKLLDVTVENAKLLQYDEKLNSPQSLIPQELENVKEEQDKNIVDDIAKSFSLPPDKSPENFR